MRPYVLAQHWGEIGRALDAELSESGLSLNEFLKARDSRWRLVGRVHFNLAENRRDPECPFAFMATYTSGLAASGALRHLPLGQALREFAGVGDNAKLLQRGTASRSRTRDAEAKRRFAISVATNGGTGARPGKDGLSATAYPSGVKGTPVEIVETTTPLLFWRKEFRRDSGGPGTQRGGHGLELEIENRSAGSIEILAAFDRTISPDSARADYGVEQESSDVD